MNLAIAVQKSDQNKNMDNTKQIKLQYSLDFMSICFR